MPNYIVRKTEAYHLMVEADSEEAALEQAEETPEYDWEQPDGPEYEVEGADA